MQQAIAEHFWPDSRSSHAKMTRLRAKPLTVAELINHYRQRELATENEWKTLSTRTTYEGYLRKWIEPRWGSSSLNTVRAVEVEMWLGTLPLARGSRAKIRNLMSVVFNHGRRHGFIDRNPISLVRQSAKRQTVPDVLLPSEINRLLQGLHNRERTLVLLAAGTGLRMYELFGLKWRVSFFLINGSDGICRENLSLMRAGILSLIMSVR
jgi:integrase